MPSSRRPVIAVVAAVCVVAGTLVAARLLRPRKLKVYSIVVSPPQHRERELPREQPERRRPAAPPAVALAAPEAKPAPAVAAAQEPSGDGSGPADSRRQLLDQIVNSGPASGKWVGQATKLFGSLRQLVPSDLAAKVDFTKTECYQRGCLLEAACSDSASYDSLNRLLLDSDTFKSWTGSKGRTAAEKGEGGRLTVSWFLMNPAEQASN